MHDGTKINQDLIYNNYNKPLISSSKSSKHLMIDNIVNATSQQFRHRVQQTEVVYGITAANMEMFHLDFACRPQRMGGLRSNNVHAQLVMGTDDDINFEDWINVDDASYRCKAQELNSFLHY